MIFTKEDAYTSYEQVEVLSREYNIHYRNCLGSLIYLFYTIVDVYFEFHKLETFSSNPGKLHYECLLHLFRYIRYTNNLGLRYYTNIEDEPVSDLLRQSTITNDNQFVVFYDSI